MPAGDTVYLTARRLHAALAGNRLRRGELHHPRWLEHDPAGRTVLGVRSVGKHLFTRFDAGLSLHSHLRMDGYRPGDRGRRPAHQARVVLGTDTRVAVGFRLHDPRLLATDHEHRLVDHLGPDPLDPSWSEAHHREAVRRLTLAPAADPGLAITLARRLRLDNADRPEPKPPTAPPKQTPAPFDHAKRALVSVSAGRSPPPAS